MLHLIASIGQMNSILIITHKEIILLNHFYLYNALLWGFFVLFIHFSQSFYHGLFNLLVLHRPGSPFNVIVPVTMKNKDLFYSMLLSYTTLNFLEIKTLKMSDRTSPDINRPKQQGVWEFHEVNQVEYELREEIE